MINIKQPDFILQSTIIPNDSNDDTRMVLTGIASTQNPSLYGEVMSNSALEQMCRDAIGLPILADHKGELDAVLGVIENAYIENNELHIDFSILPKHQPTIQEYLDNNVSLGLSIGGMAQINHDTHIVESITLVEVSITPVPANRDCHATVSVKQNIVTGGCLYGVCDALIKENFKEDEIISQEEKEMEKIQRAKTDEEEATKETPVKEEKEEKETDEPLTAEAVKEMMDERFAEEKQSIIESVLAEVKDMINKKNDDGEEVQQSVDDIPQKQVSEPVEPTINVELNTDELVEKLSSKLFDGLTERRTVSNTKMEQSVKTEPVTEVKRGMTPEEAAKMIVRNMDETDPITRAINQALTE